MDAEVCDHGRELTARCMEWPCHREGPVVARPLDEWHEDYGPVLWWRFPVEEPPFIGTPLDSDWPGYHTHWTPHPPIPEEPPCAS